MMDTYAKVVLTLIAGALLVQTGVTLTTPATARSGDACNSNTPCPVVLVAWNDTSNSYRECTLNDPCLTVLTRDR